MTAGPRGPVLLQDYQLIEKLAHQNRERIPERVVHAKGWGAYGTLKITNDISKYTRARVFSDVGKETPLHFSRFHPDYRMLDVAPTPPETLSRARGLAVANGVRYAYTGNVHDPSGGTTTCPSCSSTRCLTIVKPMPMPPCPAMCSGRTW